jgi:hypothetical protein
MSLLRRPAETPRTGDRADVPERLEFHSNAYSFYANYIVASTGATRLDL